MCARRKMRRRYAQYAVIRRRISNRRKRIIRVKKVTIYNFTPHQVIKSIRITDCRGSRGKAAYTDVTHPLNPPPVRGTFVGTRKDMRFWNTVSVKLCVIAIFLRSLKTLRTLKSLFPATKKRALFRERAILRRDGYYIASSPKSDDSSAGSSSSEPSS